MGNAVVEGVKDPTIEEVRGGDGVPVGAEGVGKGKHRWSATEGGMKQDNVGHTGPPGLLRFAVDDEPDREHRDIVDHPNGRPT